MTQTRPAPSAQAMPCAGTVTPVPAVVADTGTAGRAGAVPAVVADTAQRRVVVRERLRFARDLHDLLGPRLLAITLQCELALRLMDRTPESARSRLAEALSGMREIHEEARRVAHGYHCLSLDTEIESVRSLLESAGVRTETEPPAVPLPPPLQTVLATTVREAAANVLRHSGARNCRVTVDTPPGEVLLTVSNDGVHEPGRHGPPAEAAAPSASAPGLGLRSLAERITAAGGTLAHGPYPSGHYTVEARFPLPGSLPDGPRAA
ncbi:histidine kinase [Streptomyces sp. NPDC096153]|uniref:sensor histidine kinase n=1 Tax=Streptomyces sp. NPDC096153 TaxID=3155548 RepID=UPI00331B4F20